VGSIFKLVFYLVLWLVMGIYLIPLVLRKIRDLISDETLLVVSLGLCFMMVVIAAKTGFSAAFGAFIMGSVLAETLEAEHIERLVKPVKDLFGAIFFVSLGMMVDPAMIGKYWLPILIITLTVILGQATFATVGVLLSGQRLKTALQCGFSLTQIGEFAFIIASLGVALGVTSDFLYPIVVAVSVITIFLTPYMIRLAEPAYGLIYRTLPQKAKDFMDSYAAAAEEPVAAKDSAWKIYLGGIVKTLALNGIVAIAVCAIGFSVLLPLAQEWIPGVWGRILTAVVILVVLSPFLRAIIVKKNKSEVFQQLWDKDRANRAPLVASVVIRYVIALGFIFYVLARLFHISVILILLIALLVAGFMVFNRWTKRSSKRIEETFMTNLRSRELRAEYLGEKKPEYASDLMDKDLHLADFDIPAEVPWAGKELRELGFGEKFGVQVVSILRGHKRINIPAAHDRVFPHDRIQVIGNDSGLEAFGTALAASNTPIPDDFNSGEMVLRRLPVGADSPFLGKTIRESGFRSHWHCLVAGIEKPDGTLHVPDATVPLEDGDTVWIVGEHKDIDTIMTL
jgi:CPA2 family monovalent cation:H+ antiporter-2